MTITGFRIGLDSDSHVLTPPHNNPPLLTTHPQFKLACADPSWAVTGFGRGTNALEKKEEPAQTGGHTTPIPQTSILSEFLCIRGPWAQSEEEDSPGDRGQGNTTCPLALLIVVASGCCCGCGGLAGGLGSAVLITEDPGQHLLHITPACWNL